MKTFKVRFALTNGNTLETTIQAKTSFDAKKLLEGQYGNNLRSVYQITEVR